MTFRILIEWKTEFFNFNVNSLRKLAREFRAISQVEKYFLFVRLNAQQLFNVQSECNFSGNVNLGKMNRWGREICTLRPRAA